MNIKWLIKIMIILSVQGIYGQNVSSVNFWIDENGIIVRYDLIDETPGNQYFIELKFVSDKGDEFIPESTRGEQGKNIKPGKGKVITWDIAKDNFEFTGNLKAIITATPGFMHLGGPSNALFSVLVPGLGGHFVEENKIRPLATSVVTLGLISYGIYQKSEENKYYSDYNSSTELDDINIYYDKANAAHHKFVVSTMAGTVIWIADIIWVYYKGKGNLEKQNTWRKTAPGTGLRLYHNRNELQIGYVVNF
jgi:hypothetical protein